MTDPAPSLVVIKYGGAALSTGERIAQAARAIRDHPARQKLVVVSAPGDLTDRLMTLAQGAGQDLRTTEIAHLLSVGERISAQLLTSILRAQGASVVSLEPEDSLWPVQTRGRALGAQLDFEATSERARRDLAPLLAANIVVICGFLGRDGSQVTTLARGGSDTTAMALGSALQAEEVLLVKEVPGILDADPRVVPSANLLEEVPAEELRRLSRGGARVVSAEALRYFRPGLSVRVVPFGQPLTAQIGTRITQEETPVPTEPAQRCATPLPLSRVPAVGALTLVPHDAQQGLRALQERVAPDRWVGLSFTPDSFVLFLSEEEIHGAARALHASGAFRSVAARHGLRDLHVTAEGLAEAPTALGGSHLLGALPDADGVRLLLSDPQREFFGRRGEEVMP